MQYVHYIKQQDQRYPRCPSRDHPFPFASWLQNKRKLLLTKSTRPFVNKDYKKKERLRRQQEVGEAE